MFAVIMAGGSGTRFWPASRKDRPKQFLKITGKDPMLLETCNRLGPVTCDEEMIVVLGAEHERTARELLGERKVHITAEPVGRNTAPCIGLGAVLASHLGCSGPVAFLPADHFIAKPSVFLEDLGRAAEAAEAGVIVTLGIVPTKPETGYGYILKGEATADSPDRAIFRVASFVEKPDPRTAQRYLASGEYFWNAGIFVARPETVLGEIRQHLPDLHKGLSRLKEALTAGSFDDEINGIYPQLEAISFDYGIMERTKKSVLVVPSQCGWSDVGSWESLYDLRRGEGDENGNVSDGEAVLIDCKGNFISGESGRLITCLGLENCLVIDTPDSVLVADLGRSQEIREIVKQLAEKDRNDLL